MHVCARTHTHDDRKISNKLTNMFKNGEKDKDYLAQILFVNLQCLLTCLFSIQISSYVTHDLERKVHHKKNAVA